MKKTKSFISVLMASTMLLTACGSKTAENDKKAEGPPTYESEAIGEQPRVQDDFYTHVNYDYLKNQKLEEGKSSTGNLAELAKKSDDSIKAILANLNENYSELKDGSEEKKIIDFYNMAKDFDKRNELGLAPIMPYIDELKKVSSIEDLNKFQVDNTETDYAPFVSMGVMQDKKDSTKNILYVVGASTGLSKNYYEDTDKYTLNIQKAYKKFTADLLVKLGYEDKDAMDRAEKIFEFEKDLVSANLSKEQEIDQSIQYNVFTTKELYDLTPNLAHKAIFEKYDLERADKIVVNWPKSLEKLNEVFVNENIEVLKNIVELNILKSNINNLSKDVYDIAVEYGKAYTGVAEVESEEDLAYALVSSQFGELLGKLYVKENFNEESKAEVIAMVEKIVDAYKVRLKNVDWLSETTREKAIKKLDTLTIKIGYPDKWKDYSDINVKTYEEGGDLISVINQFKAKGAKENLSELNQAPDKSKWLMTPQTVNAYYSPMNNEIVFTAAILQAPLYSPTQSEAENLGGIGSIIGHEISHGFDSMGAQFDENGNLNNWWTEEDYVKFQEKVKQAADIYSKLEAVPGHFVNGGISTGEIMADLGGLTVALHIAEKENLDTKPLFESYAKAWREVGTKENIIANLTDEHPPGKFRVNNIANLMDKFYEDFDVKLEDKMYVKPEDRLKVW